MSEKDKKEQFVVQDRRRFTMEGEKTDSPPGAKEGETPSASAAAESQPKEMPSPPTAEEQHTQRGEYQTASKQLDDMLDAAGAKRPANLEATFEGLISSLYLQAMMQLGMVREESAPAQPDIIGARHTIDMIALLGEKTKGNLTERESHLLQNILFELRMAFLEITKLITSAPPPSPAKK
jgi:hypothetical protein